MLKEECFCNAVGCVISLHCFKYDSRIFGNIRRHWCSLFTCTLIETMMNSIRNYQFCDYHVKPVIRYGYKEIIDFFVRCKV